MKIKYNIFKAEKDEWGDRMHQQNRCMKTELCTLRRCYSKAALRTEAFKSLCFFQNRQSLSADDLLNEESVVNYCKDLQ